MELHQEPSSGTAICQVVETEHKHGHITKDMTWLTMGNEPVVKTIIPHDSITAKSPVQCWEREKDANVGAGV